MPAQFPVESIFDEARGLRTLAERSAFLDRACGGDANLRQRVEALLAAHEQIGSFLEQPAAREATDTFASQPGAREGSARFIEKPGGTIGPYQLLREIGNGGMGVVYLAEQSEPVRRQVALKIIKPGLDSRQVLARFEAERQALALMDHPNIAKVFDGGVISEPRTTVSGSDPLTNVRGSSRPYFVMELVKGVPITRYCDEHHLTPKHRLDLFIPVCQAVQHAHQKGIIHRDLKPSNVLVAEYDEKPVAKIIDFGVAKATGPKLTDKTMCTEFGQVIGTLEYMSPEQAKLNALDIDTRSDIYSLGVLLYELLTGTTPFDKKRLKQSAFDEVLRIIREEDPPRPSTRLSATDEAPSIAANRGSEPKKLSGSLRGELDWIVMKCLEKDRDRRYQTANGLAMDLQRYLADEPVSAGPPSAAYRMRKLARKNAMALATAAVIALLLVAGTAVSTWQAMRATRAEGLALTAQRAEAERAEAEQRSRQNAEAAAAAEMAAKEQAQKRLSQIEKSNEIITSIFTDLDIRKVKAAAEPLESVLAHRLVKAAAQLEEESVGDPLVVARLQDRLGRSLLNLGHSEAAIGLFVKSRQIHAAHLGADHPETLTSSNNLAFAYKDAGRLDLALPLLEETLKLRKAQLGPEHPLTITSMNNLAAVYRAAGKLDLALTLDGEILKLRKASLGTDHLSTLTSMNNLASSYKDAGKLDLALPLYAETLKVMTAKLGADHPDTLTIMNNLALTYKQAGMLDLALPLFEHTLMRRTARLGAEHPSTLTSMNNLASAYQAAGKLDLALPIYEDTLKLMKAKLGADHPNTLTSMNNLALAYQVAGMPKLALPLFEETLRLRKAKLGADHPSTLTSMNNLASAYKDAGELDLAIPLYEENLKLRMARLGVDHPNTLQSIHNLALAYAAAGKLDLALPLHEQAATAMEKLQFQHEYASGIISKTILACVAAQEFTKAETWQRKWLAHLKITVGDQSPDYLDAHEALGRNLLLQKKWIEGEAILRDCLARRQQLQPNAWMTFNTMSLLGGTLSGQKKFAEAEPLLLNGHYELKAREQTLPENKAALLRESLERLVEMYEAWGKTHEAENWRNELKLKVDKTKSPTPAGDANPNF